MLNLEGKLKGNDKALYNHVDRKISGQIHLKIHQSKGKQYFPRACCQMKSNEKEMFMEDLKPIKASNEYLSNISRCVQVEQHKIFGLKSYDYHLLMQEFLPIAIQSCLPDTMSFAIVDLCHFFKELCGKLLNENNLEHRIAKTLGQLEKFFP